MLIQSLSLFALVLGQAPDTPFLQEHHEAIPVVRGAGGPDGANDVRALAVEPNGNVWAAGYAHNLSKRTSVYADAAYATIKNHSKITEKGKAIGYSVGVAPNF